MFSRVSRMKEAPAALCLPGSLRRPAEWHLWEMFFPGPQFSTRRSRTHHSYGCTVAIGPSCYSERGQLLWKGQLNGLKFSNLTPVQKPNGFMGGGTILTEETVSEILLKRAVNLTLVLLCEFMILLFEQEHVICRRHCDEMIPYWGIMMLDAKS